MKTIKATHTIYSYTLSHISLYKYICTYIYIFLNKLENAFLKSILR